MTATETPLSGSTIASRLSSLLLNLAALGGLICIVLVALAFFFNITLIMFKTGSMSPTIPAGSVAVVREIPASEVHIGDVITVDREGALPITHRVVQITDDATGTANARLLTLKGDANQATDAAPYSVEKVRIVLASIPGVAAFVVWLSNPVLLGTITVGAAILVTWAFWPRTPRGAPHSESPDDADAPEHGRHRAHTPSTVSRATGSALGALVVACALGAAVADPPPAAAAPSEQQTGAAQLRLLSIGDPVAMSNLRPGVPVQWQLGVWAHAIDPGAIHVTLGGTGSSTLELQASVRSCEERWVNGMCASGDSELMEPHTVVLGSDRDTLTSFDSDVQRWIMFEIWMPSVHSGEAAPAGASVQLTVYAEGLGEQLSSTPGTLGQLPSTGASPYSPLIAAVGAVSAGLLLAALARVRRPWGRRTATPHDSEAAA